MRQIDKRSYQQPNMERILLDHEISLTLLSPPMGPGDEGLMEPPFEDPELM